MSSVAATLALIQQSTTRYGFPIILTLGNFGNLFCIIIFSQKHQRQSSCSLYLLASAVFGLIGINLGLVPTVNILYNPLDPISQSLIFCRFRGYMLQMSSVLYRSMVVLACADRFVLTSTRVGLRRFSNPKMALKIIGSVVLFWMLISMHLPIFENIVNKKCGVFGSYAVFFSFYQICIFGAIMPTLMITFGILLVKNLKAVRTRVQPRQDNNNTQQQVLTRRDLNLIRLALVEVSSVFLLTFLYPINLLYTALSNNVSNKSQDRIQIEAFISYITLTILFYLNYCATFYLYFIASQPFRREVKQFILKCMKRPVQEQRNATNHA
jgi:hypothetical protein